MVVFVNFRRPFVWLGPSPLDSLPGLRHSPFPFLLVRSPVAMKKFVVAACAAMLACAAPTAALIRVPLQKRQSAGVSNTQTRRQRRGEAEATSRHATASRRPERRRARAAHARLSIAHHADRKRCTCGHGESEGATTRIRHHHRDHCSGVTGTSDDEARPVLTDTARLLLCSSSSCHVPRACLLASLCCCTLLLSLVRA